MDTKSQRLGLDDLRSVIDAYRNSDMPTYLSAFAVFNKAERMYFALIIEEETCVSYAVRVAKGKKEILNFNLKHVQTLFQGLGFSKFTVLM